MKSVLSTAANLDALNKLAHVLHDGIWYAIPSALLSAYETAGMEVSSSIPAYMAANAG